MSNKINKHSKAVAEDRKKDFHVKDILELSRQCQLSRLTRKTNNNFAWNELSRTLLAKATAFL